MARPLDERQQAELTAFVNALGELGGYTSHAEWARDSGYPAPNLSELRGGKKAVDGYNLLRLIRAAAARAEAAPDDLAVAIAQALEAGESSDLIARRLEELAAAVQEALILLRAIQQPARAGRRTPGRGPE